MTLGSDLPSQLYGLNHTGCSSVSWLARQIWLLWVNIIPRRSGRSVAGENAAKTRGLERVPVGNMVSDLCQLQGRVFARMFVHRDMNSARCGDIYGLLEVVLGIGMSWLQCWNMWRASVQHRFSSNVYSLSCTEWKKAALSGAISGGLLQAPQAVVDGVSL